MDDTSAWRRWLLVLCAASFLALTWDLFTATIGPKSIAGFLAARSDPAFHERVVVFPNSPAYKGGLRTGDSVAILRLAAPDRYRFPGPYWGTDPIDVPIERHERIEMVRVRPLLARYVHQSLQVWLGFAGAFLAVAVAALLVVRRAESPEARILSLFLILGVVGSALASNNWVTPWPVLDACLSCIGFLCAVAWALPAMYALRFARPASRTRLILTGLTYVGTVAVIVYQIAFTAGSWYGVLDPFGPAFTGRFFQLTQALVFLGLPVICLGLAIERSRGEERTRMCWAAAPLAIYYFGAMASTVASLFNSAGFLAGDIANVSLFLMPLGLIYALLSQRLPDIGFALNRAAVFAATTLLLAGVFAGLQSLANITLSNLDRSHNVLLQLTIAVVVYYIVRASRVRTNALVTNLFFSQRERRIEAIRQLPDAVDELPEADAIGPFVAVTLRAQAGIFATVFWQSASGEFIPADGAPPGTVALSKDDQRIVSLRARRVPTRDPARPAEKAIVFPMLIRGQLRGVLLCEPPVGDGEFAPDEINAIATLAGRMAIARDDLLSQSLREELDNVRNRLKSREAPAG